MGAALWYAAPLADTHMTGGFFSRVIALGALCGGGAMVYAGAILGWAPIACPELKALVSRRT